MSEGFDGTLDLTGSDPTAIGFPAVPSGSYEAHVGKAEWRTTENLTGEKALPHNTPYLALGIRINEDEEERNGQKVAGQYAGWINLFVPPEDYDKTKAQSMKNRMANFLEAIGADWRDKKFKMPAAESLVGEQVTVIVRKKFDKNQDKEVNDIEGFKVAGSSSEAPAGALA